MICVITSGQYIPNSVMYQGGQPGDAPSQWIDTVGHLIDGNTSQALYASIESLRTKNGIITRGIGIAPVLWLGKNVTTIIGPLICTYFLIAVLAMGLPYSTFMGAVFTILVTVLIQLFNLFDPEQLSWDSLLWMCNSLVERSATDSYVFLRFSLVDPGTIELITN